MFARTTASATGGHTRTLSVSSHLLSSKNFACAANKSPTYPRRHLQVFFLRRIDDDFSLLSSHTKPNGIVFPLGISLGLSPFSFGSHDVSH
jgi:hypothetical protein